MPLKKKKKKKNNNNNDNRDEEEYDSDEHTADSFQQDECEFEFGDTRCFSYRITGCSATVRSRALRI